MTLQTTDSVQASDSFSPTNSRANSTTQENSHYQQAFQQLVEAISLHLGNQPQTHFTLSLAGEDSQFTRFNRAQVRQTGQVRDGQIRLTLILSEDIPPAAAQEPPQPASHRSENNDQAHRTATINLPFTGNFVADWSVTKPALTLLQQELPLLPIDPYAVIPPKIQMQSQVRSEQQGKKSGEEPGHTHEVHHGKLLKASEVAEVLLGPVRHPEGTTTPASKENMAKEDMASALDFSGLYAGGLSYRAYADSAGKHHWFETPSFTLDYSLFGSRHQEAVKGTFAGKSWSLEEYKQSIATATEQLALVARPAKAVPRGSYRTYLAPAAVADIIDTIIWGGGLGEASLRQGNSAFSKLEAGQAALSEQFSLQEDFQRISIPRFNSSGEIAPVSLPLIERGRWANSLISSRSAKEYGKLSNGANEEEIMRAPAVAPGTLKEKDILTALDTGLYISNLHYLNWSDLTAGRMTGMTRYACFWVENGKIVAPIENLRFDDDLYRFLGEGLVALTEQQTFLPAVGTYDRRALGGMWMPGMLIDQFRYTL